MSNHFVGSPLIRKSLESKLNPSRFPNMSPQMAAIVGFIIGSQFASPAITELVVTSDGFVLIGVEGQVGANEFLGSYAALLRNWLNVLSCARLTMDEYFAVQSAFAERIGYYVQFMAGGRYEN